MWEAVVDWLTCEDGELENRVLIPPGAANLSAIDEWPKNTDLLLTNPPPSMSNCIEGHRGVSWESNNGRRKIILPSQAGADHNNLHIGYGHHRHRHIRKMSVKAMTHQFFSWITLNLSTTLNLIYVKLSVLFLWSQVREMSSFKLSWWLE